MSIRRWLNSESTGNHRAGGKGSMVSAQTEVTVSRGLATQMVRVEGIEQVALRLTPCITRYRHRSKNSACLAIEKIARQLGRFSLVTDTDIAVGRHIGRR